MKQYTIFDLFQFVLTMIVPIILFIMQVLWDVSWTLGIEDWIYDYDIFAITDATPVVLIYAIVNSHCLHFCKYHRLMMYGSLASYSVYYVLPNLEPLTHNIITWLFLLIALLGFIITTFRFITQIYRYARKIYTILRAGVHRRHRQTT